MLIVHLAYVDYTWQLWGEAPATPHRGRQRRGIILPLPFGAPIPVLVTALQELGIAGDTPLGAPCRQTLQVPTRGGMPLASHALIQDDSGSEEPVQLQPWTITCLPLPLGTVLDLLLHESERDMYALGIRRGTDLGWLVWVLRFATDLVTRQRVIPSLDAHVSPATSVWCPLLLGSDEVTFAALMQAMPASLRASGIGSLPSLRVGASAILGSFVDHLMRDPTRRTLQPSRAAGTLHDRWLRALTTADGRVQGASDELAALAASVQAWTQTLLARQTAPFRLCLRLEAPEDDTASWHLRYLTQARDDPSLQIPVADLWPGQPEAAETRQLFGITHEDLLIALGQAALLAPVIAASLRQRIAWGCTLDTADAYQFLSETAWLLEDAGFVVLLPAWWTRRGAKTRLAARAHVKSPSLKGGNRLSLDQLIAVDWELVLGDTALTPEELERLARLKEPLVRLRGHWVSVDRAAITQALAFWQKRQGQQFTLREVLQWAHGAAETVAGLPVDGLRTTGWIADLLAHLEGGALWDAVPVPQGLQATLRPYQRDGYGWLCHMTQWHLGICLADDMGLGKSVQALALIQHDWETQGPAPVLIIGPTSLLENWRKEAGRFTPGLSVLIHHGSARQRDERFVASAQQHAIVLTSFPLAARDRDQLRLVAWRGIILDEAQNIKNSATKQAQAVRALRSGYRVALTGTPVENHVGDLWSIMGFLNAGYLGNEAEFRRRFFLPIQVQRDAQATEHLHRLTGPFILRRVKSDPAVIRDLPEKLEVPVYCSLTREQATLYAATLTELEQGLASAEGIRRSGLVLATLTKLKQICNHPAQFLGDGSPLRGRSGKLERLEAMLDEVLAVGERTLIFTQYAEMGALLQQYLTNVFGCEVLLLTGRTPRAQRDRMVERFQQEGEGPPIFILSLKAGGVGLNLTHASQVVHYDRWWNPAVENQATDRAYRIGQTQRVMVHTLTCVGTMEERIADLITSKREIATQVVGTGEGWLTKLSSTALRDVLALRTTILEE